MSFLLEKDMYDTALKHLPAFFDLGQLYAYGVEIPLAYRIADIGFMTHVNHDINSAQVRVFTRLKLSVLWTIAKVVEANRISPDRFFSLLGRSLPNDQKDQVLSSLCQVEVLKQDNQGWLLPTDWLLQQLGTVIWIELKLSKWEQALNQALFYLERADIACVVLDGDTAVSIHREPFIEQGIGLFAAWPGYVEMLAAPKFSNRTDPAHKHFHRLSAIQDLYRKRPRKWTFSRLQ